MKALQIDFAPRQGWLEAGTDKRRRPLWALLCLLALILLGASLTTAWSLQSERSSIKARVSALESELNANEAGVAQNELASADSADSVRLANSHLNYPWANMLGILENNVGSGVTLVSLEMGVMRQSNKFVIESADLATALSFLEGVRDDVPYASLALTRQETVLADGATRMRLTLEAPVAQPEQSNKKSGAQ